MVHAIGCGLIAVSLLMPVFLMFLVAVFTKGPDEFLARNEISIPFFICIFIDILVFGVSVFLLNL